MSRSTLLVLAAFLIPGLGLSHDSKAKPERVGRKERQKLASTAKTPQELRRAASLYRMEAERLDRRSMNFQSQAAAFMRGRSGIALKAPMSGRTVANRLFFATRSARQAEAARHHALLLDLKAAALENSSKEKTASDP